MDFIEQLLTLAKLIEKQHANITTAEATKKAFVIPFIQALGYDVFDPREVLPEFTTDVGCKKDEKVDYAIIINNKLTVLFECMSCDIHLNVAHAAQLRRYFHVTSARIGVLTNGISYFFYSDLEEKNIMDDMPFMEIDLLNIDKQMISDLKKLSKNPFELDQILSAAGELKYIRAIKNVLFEEYSSPSLEFIRFLASQVYSGIKTPQVLDQFAPIVQEAFKQFINDRLKSVVSSREEEAVDNIDDANNGFMIKPNHDIITDEEFEGFFVVNVT
jgi:hypothetical protein